MARVSYRLFIPIIYLATATGVWAGDVLYSEDFEKFNVAAPPKDVVVAGGAEVTIADDSQRGKVLNIKHVGGGYPGLSFTVDPAKVRGRTIKISVDAKCPAAYTPPADKAWAKPKLILSAKKNDGKDEYAGAEVPSAKNEWTALSGAFKVTDEISSITVNLRVELVAAEVFFDNFKVELEAGAAAPATTAAGKAPAKATPKAPAEDTSPIGKTPKKNFEDGGFILSPEIAKGLKASVKPGATPGTVALVGPGLPFKEMDTFRPIGKWQMLPVAKEVSGPTAVPTQLLAALPAFLGKNKPEVVVIFGEAASTRKLGMSERYDWEDVARICKRMGAIPIFAVQQTTNPEELRKDFLESLTLSQAPALDLKAPSTVPKRLAAMLDLFDRHIYERTPLDAPVAGKIGRTTEEE